LKELTDGGDVATAGVDKMARWPGRRGLADVVRGRGDAALGPGFILFPTAFDSRLGCSMGGGGRRQAVKSRLA